MLQKSSLFFLHCKTCLLSNYPVNVSYKFTCLALPKTILLLPNGMLSLIKSCLNHITQNKADHYKYHDTFQWYNNIQISREGVHRRKEKILPLVLKKKNLFYRDGRCTTITHAYISMTYSGILHIYCISRQALLVHAL